MTTECNFRIYMANVKIYKCQLNKVSSYLIDLTVSQIQLKINAFIYDQLRRPVNNAKLETCFKAGFTVSNFSF